MCERKQSMKMKIHLPRRTYVEEMRRTAWQTEPGSKHVAANFKYDDRTGHIPNYGKLLFKQGEG